MQRSGPAPQSGIVGLTSLHVLFMSWRLDVTLNMDTLRGIEPSAVIVLLPRSLQILWCERALQHLTCVGFLEPVRV